jgi:hypothetical protein
VQATPVNLSASTGSGTTMAVLAALLFLVAVIVPPVFARRWLGRKES